MNTQCLSCFKLKQPCGFDEQKMRKEGKKEVNPDLSQIERWTLREGRDAFPPLVRLCESEVSLELLFVPLVVLQSRQG